MNVVTSKDGTKIAYDRQGEGPTVILVAGALCARLSWSGPGLAKLLAPLCWLLGTSVLKKAA